MAVNADDELARLVLRFRRKRRWTRLTDLRPDSLDASSWRQATSLLRAGPLVSQTLDDGCVVAADTSAAGVSAEEGPLAVLHKDHDVFYVDERSAWSTQIHAKMMNELEAQQGKLAEPDERDRQAVADFHRLVTVMQSSATFENLAGKPIGEWIGVQDQENDRLVFLRQRSLLDLPRGDAFQDISVVLRLDTFKVEVFRFAQTLKIPDFPTQARTREDLIDVLSRASKLMICQGDGFSHPQYAMKKAETFGEMPEACQTRLHDLTCGQRIVVGGGFTGNTVSRAVEMGMNPATGGSAHLVRSKNCQLAFDPVSKRARRCGPCQKMLKKLSVDEKSLQETVTSQRVSKFTPVNSMSRQELKLRVLELSGEKKVMQRKRPKLSSNADMMIPNPNADEVDSTKDEHHLGHEGHLHHAVPTLHSHHAPAHQPPHAQHVGQSQQVPSQLHHSQQHPHGLAPHPSHAHHLSHAHEHLTHTEHPPPITSQQLSRYASHQHVDMVVQQQQQAQQQQQQQQHGMSVNPDGSRSSVDSPSLDQHQRQQMQRTLPHQHGHY